LFWIFAEIAKSRDYSGCRFIPFNFAPRTCDFLPFSQDFYLNMPSIKREILAGRRLLSRQKSFATKFGEVAAGKRSHASLFFVYS
jgi:hypothetical protein